MKKATLIVISLIYIASIVIISVFGLKSKVYEEVIPVSKIECLNETDDKVEVTDKEGKKRIKIKFTEAGKVDTLTGTMIQLLWRVSPDNATNKKVRFVYDTSAPVEFVQDEQGNELGLVLFKDICYIEVHIASTDGTSAGVDVILWAY